jgi:hypothetical protein
MAMKHLWGFGGVRLTCPDLSLTCTLTNTPGTLEFEPINVSYTDLNHQQHIINMGYRVKADFEAVNALDGEYSNYVTLIDILNASATQSRDIYIYPHFHATDDNLSYLVKCVSPINFESIAPTKAGQRIKLDFESVYPVPSIPTLTSDPVNHYWVYSEDAGATTDNIVDHDGNSIIFAINT